MVIPQTTAYRAFEACEEPSWRAQWSENPASAQPERTAHDPATPASKPQPAHRARVASSLGQAVVNAAILGGILLSPIVSLLGWISLVLPAPAPLRHAAAGLLVCALVWLALAVALAHVCRRRPAPHASVRQPAVSERDARR
jgi:hypothetical protein